MGQQLTIPLFQDGIFDKVREAYARREASLEVDKLKQQLRRANNRIGGFISARNQRQKKKP